LGSRIPYHKFILIFLLASGIQTAISKSPSKIFVIPTFKLNIYGASENFWLSGFSRFILTKICDKTANFPLRGASSAGNPRISILSFTLPESNIARLNYVLLDSSG
jgi:hypothetical protein